MLIYVEKQESLYSVLNKLSEVEGDSLELVVPEFALLSKSSSNFKIIHAAVQKQKKVLTVVTTDKAALYLAEKADIKVSKTPSKNAENWKKKISAVDKYKDFDQEEKFKEEESVSLESEEESQDEKEIKIVEGEVIEESEEEDLTDTNKETDIEIIEENDDDSEDEKMDITTHSKKIKKEKNQTKSFSKLAGIFIGIAAIFIIAVGLFSYFVLPKATVQIILAGKDISTKEEIKVEVGAIDVNQELLIIPGTIMTVEESSEKTMLTTGKKEVGEKATGEITIQNFETTDTIFPAGTVFTVYQNQTGEGLLFTADSGITVTEATESFEDDEEGNPQKIITPASATVSVTAGDKGTDYNLSANTTFIVGTELYTSYRGKNNVAFTGGSSQEVSIVDQADITNVLNQLSAELKTKAEEDLRSKLVGDQKMVNKTVVHTILSQVYDKNVGDEASEIKLSLKTESRATAYSDSQIKQLLSGALEQLVTGEYLIKDEDVVVTAELLETEDDGNLLFEAQASTTTYPILDENEIRAALKGLKPQEAEAYLKGLEKVLGYNISSWPPFPQLIRRLPFIDSRLAIETTTQAE